MNRKSLQDVALLMLDAGRSLFARGTVLDAVAWDSDGDMRVAWVMDPKRMRPAGVGHDAQVPFSGSYAARVFEARGVRADTLKYEREMVLYDFLDRLANDLYGLVGDSIKVTIIPAPGYPWPAPGGYYSAKRREWLESPRPDWLQSENIVDASRGINSPGVDLCRFFGEPLEYKIGAEVIRYGRKDDDFALVTHAMGTIEGMTRYGRIAGVEGWEENAKRVKSCGGLLFPSMAVGPIPATNFGVGVLVADAGLVLNALRGRGEKPSTVYSSDAWTGRTGDFFADTSIAAFEQMHGHSDYLYNVDLNVWPLGAPKPWSSEGPASLADEIVNISSFKRELKDRFRLWNRHLSPDDTEELMESVALTKARYGYLEAKANGVMRISEFPLAAIPPQQEEGFRRFLDITGFSGELLVVDLPDEILEVMLPEWDPPGVGYERKEAIKTWASMQYGWHVADAVRNVARTIDV